VRWRLWLLHLRWGIFGRGEGRGRGRNDVGWHGYTMDAAELACALDVSIVLQKNTKHKKTFQSETKNESADVVGGWGRRQAEKARTMSLTRSTSLAFPDLWERRSMTSLRSPMASSYAAIAAGTSDGASFESRVTACCARRSASVNSSRDEGRDGFGGGFR